MIKEIYKLNLYVDGKMYEQLPLEVFNVLDLKTNDYMEQPLKEAKYCVVDSPLIIPGLSEPPVRTLRATIPENESHIFR